MTHRFFQFARLSAVAAALAVIAFLATGASVRFPGGDLSEVRTSLFAGSGNCAVCHSTNGEVLLDSEGNDLSPPADWRSTMMANSFRDPYFQATLAKEVALRPNQKMFIEDFCLKCHAPMAHKQAHHDGATHLTLEQAHSSELAMDGVSCTLCHQIQPDDLGTHASYNGGYVIKPTRQIFGPYPDVYTFAMQSGVNYTPMFGAHKQDSAVCATCHTLFTPILDDAGMQIGEFPEQVPFLEWRNSVFSKGTSLKSCQECHMPRLDEEVYISHDPPVEPRGPFWRHYFVGGNAFMLRMIRDNAEALGATASSDQFDTTIARTLHMLQKETARVSVRSAKVHGGIAEVIVRVTNLAGHKLPTGFSARRVWLHFTARQGTGGPTVFESGQWNGAGNIFAADEPFEAHHEAITTADQVQIYEAVIGDRAGGHTYSLLSAATFLKDNRLPPQGFLNDGPDAEHTAIRGGAATDPNFNRRGTVEGTGSDDVIYRFPFAGAEEELRVTAHLMYQSISPRYVDDLRSHNLAPISTFLAMYDVTQNTPILITETSSSIVNPADAWVME